MLRFFGSFITSFLFCFILYPFFIKKLVILKIKQNIRTYGPITHFKKKNTPTMGGVIMLCSLIINSLLWLKLKNRFTICLLSCILWLGLLGIYDDYLKLTKDKKGLTIICKITIQLIFALFITIYLNYAPPNPNFANLIRIPFLKNFNINLSYMYPILLILIIIGSSNAVNLTDGLDGLAIGNTIIVSIVLAILAYLASNRNIAKLINIIPIQGSEEISIFLMSIVGSGLGFLWYNIYPAEIFMGDSGSLFLGGILGLTAILIKQELILLLLGGVFVIEAVSVIIQIYYYKKYNKRIFKMTPIHHHFEILGINEIKITIRFWILTIILSIFSILSIFYKVI
ncbi:MAG: phospho-N-acetylmuramoyl-pentapeptide-transferase [Endomicrobium sp.]|jgi:phospho-N-acetylmuramoyl-pentapeptide-transferase|nr:phospho-N-acetylmuramoyl-pentapeptide-transferase [Endomicrobium sp.]